MPSRTAPIAAALLLIGTASGAEAGFLWRADDGGNGHSCDLVVLPGAMPWHAARGAAAASAYLGSTGHLLTLTSAGEDAFVRSHFESLVGDPTPPPDRPTVARALTRGSA